MDRRDQNLGLSDDPTREGHGNVVGVQRLGVVEVPRNIQDNPLFVNTK